MSRFSLLIMTVLVLAVVAAGCGRKGDLELPPEDDRERPQDASQ
jgi:predicted small lipoprotein YifL